MNIQYEITMTVDGERYCAVSSRSLEECVESSANWHEPIGECRQCFAYFSSPDTSPYCSQYCAEQHDDDNKQDDIQIN